LKYYQMLRKIRRDKIRRLELGWFEVMLEAERSSSSGRNAVNGVITIDRRSGVCVAAPTSSCIDRKEEKRQAS